ncbi:LptM family lipoprotein [Flavivirga algicola]|uniref:Type IV secretion system putative lipoprotein virB7 n=1 Tax=Flavivirga algicola TaxID=2729136 RepID=A0ABX1RSA4_9FLAO|nr:hypothetical protein [Flavivirga algicola]NMH86429.1 hypothetical protein [Flavivirga algicola]
MKKFFLAMLSIITLTGCSIKSDTQLPDPQTVIIHWNLTKITGGVAGVNEEFTLNTIVWTFGVSDLKLTVENNNTDDTKQDGLDSGTYDYSITETSGKSFLNIGSNEFGRFTVTNNTLVIDQNELSQGSGTDGFVYTFQKTIEVID